MKLSSQSSGMSPELKTASASCLMSSTPSSLAAFNISAMTPDGPEAFPHFILPRALLMSEAGTFWRGPAVGGTSGSLVWATRTRCWVAVRSARPKPSSCHHRWAPLHRHHFRHSFHLQHPGLSGPSAWPGGINHCHLLTTGQTPPSRPWT